MSGTFHHMSLLYSAPQLQQRGSAVGTMRPHDAQGRRGAIVSRPHAPHARPGAAAPQNGHERAGAAPWPCTSKLIARQAAGAALPVSAASIAIPCSRLPGIPMR